MRGRSITVPPMTLTSIAGAMALSAGWFTVRRLVAAMLAAGALLLAVAPAPPPLPTETQPDRSSVLIAARDLEAGASIGAGDLQSGQRTTAELPDGALTPSEQTLGRVLTGSIRRGEVITDRRLLGPGLSASLGPGVVASPVRLVDLDVAALLRAGDRVTILAATEDSETASVVAADALVLSVPRAGAADSEPGSPLGLLIVAVSQDTAAALAAAGASSVLTATLLPP